MSAEQLIARLDGVRRAGDGQWRARCPSHGSKGGTLSVREEADGRVLVHCFAGCGAEAIVGAVGLDIAALFPERRIDERVPRGPRPAIDPREVLLAVRDEALVCAVIVSTAADGEPVDPADRARLFEGAGILARAAEVARG
jgi:hypothetical protein